MKLGTPVRPHKARIEIIPLIDIMFFLLACFMVISLKMIQMRGMNVSLPTAQHTTPETKSDFLTVSVDPVGNLSLEQNTVTREALLAELKRIRATNENTRIYIKGDRQAMHGDIIAVLDTVRSAGIQKVAFEIRSPSASDSQKEAAPATPAPVPPAAPAAPMAPAPSGP